MNNTDNQKELAVKNIFFEKGNADSKYVKLSRVNFTISVKRKGQSDSFDIKKAWDVLTTMDSVCIMAFMPEKHHQSFLFVKQFRPAVLNLRHIRSLESSNTEEKSPTYQQSQEDAITKPNFLRGSVDDAMTLELCAGLIDKNGLTIEEIAAEEIEEELGFKIEHANLQKIQSYLTATGTSSAVQHLYYCELFDSMKIPNGGGGSETEDEYLEVIEIKKNDLFELLENSPMDQLNMPQSVLTAVLWFKLNKLKHSTEN